jgi:hypothetical protein
MGTLRKSGNAGTTTLDANVAFNNTGTVDIRSGTLLVDSGGVFNTGTTIIGSGTLTFGSVTTFNGLITTTNLQLTAGETLTGTNVLAGTLTLGGGTLTGVMTIATNGVINASGGGTASLSALTLTNYGTVIWTNTTVDSGQGTVIYNYGLWNAQSDDLFQGDDESGPGTTFYNMGTLRKSGNTGTTTLDANVTLYNTGTVDVQSGEVAVLGSHTLTGGTLNFGINSLNNFSQIFLAGSAGLTGTLSANLNNGYSPVTGSSFALLSYGSESGTFTTLNLPHLSGLTWQPNYGGTTFTLIVTNVPVPLLQSAISNANSISLSWYALQGQTYQIQYTTNLVPASWVNLGNTIGGTNGLTTVAAPINLNPHLFYRLVDLP